MYLIANVSFVISDDIAKDLDHLSLDGDVGERNANIQTTGDDNAFNVNDHTMCNDAILIWDLTHVRKKQKTLDLLKPVSIHY